MGEGWRGRGSDFHIGNRTKADCSPAQFWHSGQVVSTKQERQTSRPDPHPIRDFFIAELIDYAPKDSTEMMERPFFSLSKRPRKSPIEYKNADGSLWIKVTAHPDYGMATIWDADILIWCISQIMAARERGDNDFGRTIYTSPYELLRGIARGTSGRDYVELMAAIKRLRSTDVECQSASKCDPRIASGRIVTLGVGIIMR
jgi:plasmid replication initiation protein